MGQIKNIKLHIVTDIKSTTTTMAADLESLVNRLEKVATRLESVKIGGGGGGGAAVSDDDPAWYDEFKPVQEECKKFLDATQALGGDVATQGKLVEKAFQVHQDLLTIAARNNAPKP